VEDRAQSIFKRKRTLIADTGMDFRGRSKILTINYRNTAQIVQFAWDFYKNHSQLENKVREGSVEGIEIIPPQSTKRKGPEPFIKRCNSISEEMDYVVQQIEKLHEESKIPYADMVILYRVQNSHHTSYIEAIKAKLGKHKLPYYWITENAQTKRNFDRSEDTIKISTIDSAKGLDFRAVFIVSIENMPFPLEEVEEREVSLFYIGMTRALEWLYLTYSGTSKFTEYLDGVLAKREEKHDNFDKKMG
jgi:superfamily I DNA/RNA helicase